MSRQTRDAWTKAVALRSLSKPRSKYGNRKVTVEGIVFHSKREAARYGELRLREKAGDIRNLRLQPHYTLCALALDGPDPRNVNAGVALNYRWPVAEYVADFEYEESDRGYGGVKWSLVVEDVKGMKTDVYKLKKKLFENQYGITLRET